MRADVIERADVGDRGVHVRPGDAAGDGQEPVRVGRGVMAGVPGQTQDPAVVFWLESHSYESGLETRWSSSPQLEQYGPPAPGAWHLGQAAPLGLPASGAAGTGWADEGEGARDGG